ALRVDAHGGAKVDVLGLEALRAHLHPPVEELGMPFLQRALEPTVVGEAHVVRDTLAVVDTGHHTLLRSNSLRRPGPYTSSAPLGPGGGAGREDPVLRGGERPKALARGRRGPAEADRGFHTGERVGRERRTLLERDAALVVPVDVVGREGDQPRLGRGRRVEVL